MNQIDNKKEFKIFILLNFVIAIFVSLIGIILIYRLITHEWIIFNTLIGTIAIYIISLICIIFALFDSQIKPSYFETIVNEKEIIIRTFTRTFNPKMRNKFFNIIYIFFNIIHMLRYKKYLKELKLSQQEYNDYKLMIDKWGMRKILILQKINKNGIYETSKINISLLGQKKYTNLILSIDRLKGKINFN